MSRNHYHFVLQTRQPNLSRLMRHINGVYTQSYNRRHAKIGHLFQGRFKAVLVMRTLISSKSAATLTSIPFGRAWSSGLQTGDGAATVPTRD